MFTGIVEGTGTVAGLRDGRLSLSTGLGDAEPWRMGESVSVDGCCLTVVGWEPSLQFDLSPETLARTHLGDLRPGDQVNLERAMRADGRFGGHIVQGHVDGVGHVISVQPSGNSTVMRFQSPISSFLIDKGSITVNGVSLTVVSPDDTGAFDVWVIPHTLEVTSLGRLTPGDRVNLEYDVIAKYVARLMGR